MAETKAQLQQELQDLQATFDLRWKADMRAIKRWQKLHPDKPLTWPDHADLVIWLAERTETIRDEYQRFYNFVGDADPALVDAWHFGENVRVQKEARERRG